MELTPGRRTAYISMTSTLQPAVTRALARRSLLVLVRPMRPLSRLTFIVLMSVAFTGCEKRTARYIHIGPDSLPTKSYEHRPEEPFNRSDYGFDGLSFILTETQAGGGPPLHTHESEESHIVLHGQVEYVIGDRRFTVEGPYVVRVPAGVPHTFRNAGIEPFNLIAVFPDKHLTYKELGKNPLVQPAK